MTEQDVLKMYASFQQAMIDKDINMLLNLTSEDVTFRHMSGKVQTRKEFFEEIENGTLNYYQSTLLEYRVEIENNIGHISGTTRLDAKVYGIKGCWDLPISQWYKEENGTIVMMKK